MFCFFFHEKCSASYGELKNGKRNSSRYHNQYDPKKGKKKHLPSLSREAKKWNFWHRNPYMGNKQTPTERKVSSGLQQASVAEKEMGRDLAAQCAQHGSIR